MKQFLNWFESNPKSFLISLSIPISLILFVILFPKWLIILLSSITYLGLLGYKINQNKPF